MASANVLNSLVPITQFNKGQASKIFDRLRTQNRLIVLKNNSPSAVILSPEEYERLSEIEENYQLLLLAQKRMESGSKEHAITFRDAMDELGISEEELKGEEDIEIQ